MGHTSLRRVSVGVKGASEMDFSTTTYALSRLYALCAVDDRCLSSCASRATIASLRCARCALAHNRPLGSGRHRPAVSLRLHRSPVGAHLEAHFPLPPNTAGTGDVQTEQAGLMDAALAIQKIAQRSSGRTLHCPVSSVGRRSMRGSRKSSGETSGGRDVQCPFSSSGREERTVVML